MSEEGGVNGWLLALTIITPALLIVINSFIVSVWSSPEDKGQFRFQKGVATLGLVLAQVSVLLLPLDVANQQGTLGCGIWRTVKEGCGGIDMGIVWQIVFLTILGFVVVIIPFATFHYDSQDIDVDTGRSRGGCGQCCRALKYQFISLLLGVGIVIPMIIFLSETSIKVQNYAINVSSAFRPVQATRALSSDAYASCGAAGGGQCEKSLQYMKMRVSVPVYIMAMMSFVGWFLFVLYAGIGLVSLPFGLIRAFIKRPRPLPAGMVQTMKKQLNDATSKLIEVGEKLQRELEDRSSGRRAKLRKADRKTLNQFKQSVYTVEMQNEELKLCDGWDSNPSCGNTLLPWFKLFMGVFCIIISIVWFIHLCVYLIPIGVGAQPASPFLNDFFNLFSNFPEIGAVFVGLFTFYLLACVVSGNFKFGMRFLFCMSIHPMEWGGTLMNSFLTNVSLILWTVPAVCQFSAQAFADYIRLTDLQVIMGDQVKNLEFFKYFFEYNIFVWALLVVVGLSLGFTLLASCCPCCPSGDEDAMTRWRRIEKRWAEIDG